MELEQARKVEAARTNFLKVATEQDQQDYDLNLTPEERFRSIQVELEGLVDHRHIPGETGGERTTKLVHVDTVDGPLPNIGLRFKYKYAVLSGREFDLKSNFNEYGELPMTITAEWVHSPDGERKTAEPAPGDLDAGTALEWGEVFATETIYFGSGFEVGPDEQAITLLEQSLDIYQRASQTVRYLSGSTPAA